MLLSMVKWCMKCNFQSLNDWMIVRWIFILRHRTMKSIMFLSFCLYKFIWIITEKLMPTTIPIGFHDLCIAASWKSIIHVNIKSHTNDSTFVVTWACFYYEAHILLSLFTMKQRYFLLLYSQQKCYDEIIIRILWNCC